MQRVLVTASSMRSDSSIEPTPIRDQLCPTASNQLARKLWSCPTAPSKSRRSTPSDCIKTSEYMLCAWRTQNSEASRVKRPSQKLASCVLRATSNNTGNAIFAWVSGSFAECIPSDTRQRARELVRKHSLLSIVLYHSVRYWHLAKDPAECHMPTLDKVELLVECLVLTHVNFCVFLHPNFFFFLIQCLALIFKFGTFLDPFALVNLFHLIEFFE